MSKDMKISKCSKSLFKFQKFQRRWRDFEGRIGQKSIRVLTTNLQNFKENNADFHRTFATSSFWIQKHHSSPVQFQRKMSDLPASDFKENCIFCKIARKIQGNLILKSILQRLRKANDSASQ